MLAEFWEFASHFITIEELQATAFLTVISIIIIISAYITDKYEKRGIRHGVHGIFNMVAERNKQPTRANKKHCYTFIMYFRSAVVRCCGMVCK